MGNFNLILSILTIAVVMGVVLGGFAYLTLLERKISAWMQDRKGPNRVGPLGLLQPIADGVKFLLKEEVLPKHVDKLFYILGPAIATATALLALAVVPFGQTTTAPKLVNHWSELTKAEKEKALPIALAIVRTERSGTNWLDLSEDDREPAIAKAQNDLPARGRTIVLELMEAGTFDQLRKAPQFPEAAKDFPGLPPSVEKASPREDFWPQTVDERAYVLASDTVYASAPDEPTFVTAQAAYNDTYQFAIAPNLDIGIVFVFAVGSLNVYSIILGGWASNNKYSIFGGLRASAQVISYEIPMGMSILGVVLLAGSLNLEQIINYQVDHTWLVFYQPLAVILFITAVFAECNRLPFDLPECEQELVAGYHTEYSGMKFALFMIGEYTHMITTSFLVVILFFGGWQILPFVGDVGGSGVGGTILKLIVLCGKMFLFICFYMLVRWTLPRFRFDQLMGLAWKVLLPLALVNLVAVLVVKQLHWPPVVECIVLLLVSLGLLVGAGYLTQLMPKPPPPEPARFRLARMQAETATRA